MTDLFKMMVNLAGSSEPELRRQIKYLKAGNEILRSKINGPVRVTKLERARLVKLGKRCTLAGGAGGARTASACARASATELRARVQSGRADVGQSQGRQAPRRRRRRRDRSPPRHPPPSEPDRLATSPSQIILPRHPAPNPRNLSISHILPQRSVFF